LIDSLTITSVGRSYSGIASERLNPSKVSHHLIYIAQSFRFFRTERLFKIPTGSLWQET